MSTFTKQFSFNSTLESWAFSANGATSIADSRDTTEDAPNDSNAGTGVLQTRRTAKNKSDGTPYWEWAGTWEDLGVPAGATITAVDLDYDWRCSEYATGASTSATGPAELRDSAGTLRGTFSSSLTFSATGSFATRDGTALTGLSDASTTSIRLRLGAKPNTGNSNSAAVTLRQDWIVVTVTYTLTFTYTATGGAQSGGAADLAKVKNYQPSGGAQSGGAALTEYDPGTQIFTYAATGGATSGGAADLAKVKAYPVSGGIQSGGAAELVKVKAYMPTGGIQSAGAALLAICKSYTSSGGALAGGQAQTQFQPAGGGGYNSDDCGRRFGYGLGLGIG